MLETVITFACNVSEPFVLFGNALPRIATNTMKKLQLTHIYGSVVLTSQYCPHCKTRSFIGDRFSCCGRPIAEGLEKGFRIEVDKVGSKRKRPSKSVGNQILLEQDGRCFYCGDLFGDFRKIDGEVKCVVLNWDHVVPFTYDGNNRHFVAACSECNHSKSSLHFADLDEAKTFLAIKMHERKASSTS